MVNDNLAVGNWYADDTDKTDELGLKFPFGMQVIFHLFNETIPKQ